jgi:hypothetical protein
MAIELIRFLAAALIILIPGICLARAFLPGGNLLEHCATGSSLGLAVAVYFASIVSHLDLRLFYPAWAIFVLICIASWLKSARLQTPPRDSAVQIWMVLVLLVVGITRFALALPRVLPPGALDPTFHLILAEQIQITHHAINSWPFAAVPLNYPTGSHILLVILSALSGLPLHTVFKDLIPLLGILTTAQLYVFTRQTTGSALTAVYAAAIYGLWAWYGSIDYFRWGGLPNELAMLLFLAMLSLSGRSRSEVLAMSLLFSSLILVHHHVMVAAAAVLFCITLWQLLRRKSWPTIATAALCGAILDAFYLIPYAGHLGTFHSTELTTALEPIPWPLSLPHYIGYALTGFALLGIALATARKIRCPSVVVIAAATLGALFIIGDYVAPFALNLGGGFFTPTRFLSDLNYFLPIFAAGALVFFQSKLRAPQWIVLLLIFVAALADFQYWIQIENAPEPSPQFIAACTWIRQNTPEHTLIDNPENWATYLCWREAARVPMPISEPIADYSPASARIPLILESKVPPHPPDLTIVAICDPHSYNGGPILWHDESGELVVQEWPITTSSSSVEVTPAPKPPGPPPASGPTSP